VTVYGAFGNQSFSAQTDSNGNFGAFIDPGLANCPTNCTINLYPNNPGKYTTASYSVPTIGDLGNLAIGAINASVSIFTPTNGINGLPNPWAWLAVSEVDSVTSTIITRYGVFANELGVAGLNLTTGKRYQLTAYPSWQFYAQYSPKSIEISSFDPSISSNYSITFNSPNVTLIVQDKKGNPNSWGWYQVYQKNGVSSNWIQNGYLNELGRSGISLDPGDYEISIYPGKTAGVESKIMLNISSSNIATSSNSDVAITNNVAIIKLPDGNISGIVYAKDGVTPVSNIPITAVKDIDSSTVVTAITQKDGSFSLNLNLDFSWTLNALDPITLNTGTLSLSATTPSNKSIPGQNITLK
jgi:hypothetical protein